MATSRNLRTSVTRRSRRRIRLSIFASYSPVPFDVPSKRKTSTQVAGNTSKLDSVRKHGGWAKRQQSFGGAFVLRDAASDQTNRLNGFFYISIRRPRSSFRPAFFPFRGLLRIFRRITPPRRRPWWMVPPRPRRARNLDVSNLETRRLCAYNDCTNDRRREYFGKLAIGLGEIAGQGRGKRLVTAVTDWRVNNAAGSTARVTVTERE